MDKTENIRREMVAAINSDPDERAQLEAQYGEVWDTKQVQEKFEIIGFLAPFVAVKELATGIEGTLAFQDRPRYYFDFRPK